MKRLNFSYEEPTPDGRGDILTIEGFRYSGELFRLWAGKGILRLGEPFRIIKREDGVITIQEGV